MCSVYLHSGVLAIKCFGKLSVLGDPMDTPVNEPDWFGSWGCGQVVGGPLGGCHWVERRDKHIFMTVD